MGGIEIEVLSTLQPFNFMAGYPLGLHEISIPGILLLTQY